MINYFVPISLMVFAGFTLGLLVGRLAWGTSQPRIDRQADEPRVGRDVEAAVVAPSPASDQPVPDLPVWQMKEVRSRQRLAAPTLLIEADPDLVANDDPDAIGAEQTEAEIARGGSS